MIGYHGDGLMVGFSGDGIKVGFHEDGLMVPCLFFWLVDSKK